MRSTFCVSLKTFSALTSIVLFGTPLSAFGQQVTTQMPLQSNSHSFFERSNVSWSIRSPHYFLSFNGGGAEAPFGGANPNAGISGGFAVGNARMNFGFAQGGSLSSSTFAPVLTTTSGYPGSIFAGTVRPFVTGMVPVVGAAGAGAGFPVGPLAQRISTGELPLEQGRIVTRDHSVEASRLSQEGLSSQSEDIQRQLTARKAGSQLTPTQRAISEKDVRNGTADSGGHLKEQATAEDHFVRGIEAEKMGKYGLAKVYFQLASAKGDGRLKLEADARLAKLDGKLDK